MTQSVNDAIMAALGGSTSINDRLHQFFGSSLVHAHRDARWHAAPDGMTAVGTSNAVGNQTLRAGPFVITRRLRITEVAIDVTSAGEAGSVIRFGVYSDDTASGGFLPKTLVSEFGTVAGDAIATPSITGLTVNLDPGLYWMATVVQGAPTTQPTVRTTNQVPYTIHDATAAGVIQNLRTGYSHSAVSGALPAAFVNAGVIGLCVRVGYKVTLL